MLRNMFFRPSNSLISFIMLMFKYLKNLFLHILAKNYLQWKLFKTWFYILGSSRIFIFRVFKRVSSDRHFFIKQLDSTASLWLFKVVLEIKILTKSFLKFDFTSDKVIVVPFWHTQKSILELFFSFHLHQYVPATRACTAF